MRPDAADAAAGRDRGAVVITARQRDERVVHVRRAGGARTPGFRPGLLPGGVPRRDGGARGAARRPRAERALGVGVLRRARARHRVRRRRRAPAGGADRGPRRRCRERRRAGLPTARRGAPRGQGPLRVLRRHRPARGRRGGRLATAGRRPARRGGRLARCGDRRTALGLRRRGRDAAGRAGRTVRAQRDVRRLPQAGDGRGRVPPLRGVGRLPRRAGAAGGEDRRPLARRHAADALPRRPGRRDRGRLAAHQRRSPTPTTPTASSARSAPTSAAPIRATRPASSTGACPTGTGSSVAAAPTVRRWRRA